MLVDELKRPVGRRAQVIVEAKTRNVLRLLQSACSRRVIAVPTTQVAARRWAALFPDGHSFHHHAMLEGPQMGDY